MLMIINFINKFNMKKIILTILSIIFLQTNVFSFPISAVAFKKCNSHLLITVNECKVKQKYSKEIKEPEIRPTNEYYLNSVEQNISLFADIDLMSISNTVNGIVAKIVSGTKATEAIREQANINVAESYSNIGNPQGKLADLVFSNSLVESANRDLENGRYITGTIKGLIATTQTALIFTGLGESVSGIRTVAGTSGYNAVATKATTIAENITTKEIANTVGKVETITDTSKYLGKEIGETKLVTGEQWARKLRAEYGDKNVEWVNATPSQLARSWQGTYPYFGVDNYVDVTITKGTVLFRGEPNGTEFFTTRNAIEQSERNATKLFEGLQVRESKKYGYKSQMVGYVFKENTIGAYGRAVSNTDFGKGGLEQYFIPNIEKYIEKGIVSPIEEIKLKK